MIFDKPIIMKKILLTSLSVLCLAIAHAQDKKEDPIKLKGVEVVNDYHENISWIKSKPIALVKKDFLESAYEVSYIQILVCM